MARRWSLLARMGVSLAVLTSFSVAIALSVAAIDVLIGFIALGWLFEALTVVSYAPGVTDFLALEPWLVMTVSAAGLVAVGYGWWRLSQYTAVTSLFENEYHPVSLAAVGLGLALLYLLVVEGSKAVVQSLDMTYGFLFSGALFAVLAVWSFVERSQRELQ